jgi:hypothetical protein
MKPTYVAIGGAVAVVIGYWYYQRRAVAIQQSTQNPNASTDNDLGSIIANSNYQGATGQNGDTYTGNYRYSEYLQYMQQGGTNSGSTFDQFLTAAESQSLPTS